MDHSRQTELGESTTEWGQDTTHLALDIRQKVNRGTDIVLRSAYIVKKDWLLKTSSGKIARSANRAKYLTEIGE
jgi:acyl-coenzyme A synthetase/AMP-(fatty) acid ligase